MPLFNLFCGVCGRRARRLAPSVDKLPKMLGCQSPTCLGLMERAAAGPGSAVIERLDNGVMIRPLERFADAERLYADRRAKSDPLAGGRIRTGED